MEEGNISHVTEAAVGGAAVIRRVYMRGAVELRTDGCTDLQMDSNKQYIVTKWYGSSLAIFEEAAFQKYLRRLDTDFKDNGHGQSVIRYFLSAAVTMMTEESDGWRIPPELLTCIEKDGERLEYWECEINSSYQDSLPVFVVAASGNMDSAIEMTKERHAA